MKIRLSGGNMHRGAKKEIKNFPYEPKSTAVPAVRELSTCMYK